MGKRIALVDQYILKAQPFAQPVLNYFRELVHAVCPDVEEKMKWSFPHFDYKGSSMCSMAAFKQHCAVGFWKASLIDPKLVDKAKTEEAMGHFGKITSVKDLPSDKKLTAYIKAAMKLNEAGIVVSKPKPDPKAKKNLVVPKDLLAALNKKLKAKSVWDDFAYSHKKEYIQWIEEAKTEATRNKRILTTVEWVAEGKGRNWKYERK